MPLLSRNVFALLAFIFMVPASYAAPSLPANLTWLSNDTDPVFASPDAIKGGTFRNMLLSFPLTFRYVGPDSNGSFRNAILGNQMSLVETHPNTYKLLPSLATQWAYSEDNTTMYFRLDPNARWSDGKPVVAEDYAFTLEFMRSKEIVAPWYNTYYGDEIGEVIIYDEQTISISSSKPRPKNELHARVALSPTPRHFYQELSGFVQKYNWKVAPNTGAYQISDIKKGKSITFKRKKDWWAKDLKYFKNRFNVDKVRYTVIRDINLAWEHFKKAKLDWFALTQPLFWHEKAKGEIIDKGHVHKLWFYNESPQASTGLWLNQDNSILKDINVRLGIAHAFNIDKVNRQVLRGDYVRKHSISSGFGEFDNLSIKARKFDLKKAHDYFSKAGWNERGGDGIRVKNGQRMSFAITYGTDLHTPRLAVLKEEFKRAGVEIILRKLDSAASFKSVLEKKHDIWWGALIGGRWPQYWGQFHSLNAHKKQTNNFTNTDDPDIDRTIEAFRSAMNATDRVELSQHLQQMIHDQSAWIPRLDVPYERVGFWRWINMPERPGTRLGGAAVSPFDSSSGGLFWIDDKMKKETLKDRKKGKSYPASIVTDTTFKVE